MFSDRHKKNKAFRVAVGAEPSDRPIAVLRGDLKIMPQKYYGQLCFVIKDPVTLRYYRIQPIEYFLIQQLDGKRTARDLLGLLQQQFPESELTVQEILKFIGTMHESHLLSGEGVAHAEWLAERKNKSRRRKILGAMSNFLFVKIPLFNPNRLLNGMELMFGRLIFNRVTGWLSLLFCLSGLIVFLTHIDRLRQTPYSLMSWENMAILWCVYVITKIFHEFGHGLTTKHFGGEVSQMGVLMLVMTPSFYCDTSDAWMIPSRAARLWINSGGIIIELILAALAAWVWAYTQQDTLISQIALNAMISCSVATLFFNINPLMKFDGYYFLSDLLEIPNLMTKGRQMLKCYAQKYLLGLTPSFPQDSRRAVPLVIYAVASGIYRWIIFFGILTLLFYFFDKYGLGPIGVLLAILYVIMTLVVPFFKTLKYLWKQRWDFGRRVVYVGSSVAVAAGICLIIAILPWTMRIREPLVVLSEHDEPIFVRTPGYVEKVEVEAGEFVKTGQVIVSLRDPSLQTILDQSITKREQQKMAVTYARAENKPAELAAAMSAVEAYDQQIELIRQRIEDLQLRSPIDGIVIRENSLGRIVGNYVAPGVKLCRVIQPEKLQALISLPQQKAAMVQEGMDVQIRLWSNPDQPIRSVISRVSANINDTLIHPALASTAKGEVAVADQDPQTGQIKTLGKRSTVVIELPYNEGMFDGMTGRGEITIQRTTVAGRLWRFVLDTTTPDWHL